MSAHEKKTITEKLPISMSRSWLADEIRRAIRARNATSVRQTCSLRWITKTAGRTTANLKHVEHPTPSTAATQPSGASPFKSTLVWTWLYAFGRTKLTRCNYRSNWAYLRITQCMKLFKHLLKSWIAKWCTIDCCSSRSCTTCSLVNHF